MNRQFMTWLVSAGLTAAVGIALAETFDAKVAARISPLVLALVRIWLVPRVVETIDRTGAQRLA